MRPALIATKTPIRPAPTVPDWVDQWVGLPTATDRWDRDDQGIRTTGQVLYGKRFTHVGVRVHNACQLPDLELQHATTEAYRRVRRALDDGEANQPVRFWNFIPGIGNDAGGGLDRYMVFNAGRFAAFSDWFHATDRNLPAPRIATATGVGHSGADLIVHCLGDRLPGKPVENPRQCAAYRYSEAYGPLPPCFARATVIAADERSPNRRVMIGGTSSIVGEASVHIGDLPAQTRETLDNIEALLHAAGASGLDALHAVRVYHVEEHDGPGILAEVLRRLPRLEGQIEMVHAPLCRRDLGVEIEGLADA
ncbi:MAG: pteridine-dependent deoxygenase like protein [Planctomycetota bacterium]